MQKCSYFLSFEAFFLKLFYDGITFLGRFVHPLPGVVDLVRGHLSVMQKVDLDLGLSTVLELHSLTFIVSACSGLATADSFPAFLELSLQGEFWSLDWHHYDDVAVERVHVNSRELFVWRCGCQLNAKLVAWQRFFCSHCHHGDWSTPCTRCSCLLATHCSKSSAACGGRGLTCNRRKSRQFKQTETAHHNESYKLSVAVTSASCRCPFKIGRHHSEGPWKHLLWGKKES